MDPTKVFCDNPDCSARGKCGEGTIKVHSHKEQRYRCTACGRTFAASKGSPFYRLHKDRFLFVCVITLLSHGCPPQAIVAAYGLDERTIADWHNKSGSHCQGIHDHHLNTKPLDLQHVQADELHAKRVGGRSWMALAMAVPTRLWLGGVVSPIRNLLLIQRLVNMVHRAWLPGKALLICVDGLSSYLTAFWIAVPRDGPDGSPWAPAVPSAGVRVARPSDQELLRPTPQGRLPPRGLGQRRDGRTATATDQHGQADQHRLHRETERDVPSLSDNAGAAWPSAGTSRRDP